MPSRLISHLKDLFGLWRAELPLSNARAATATAAAFNFLGLLFELAVLTPYSQIERWPIYLSMGVGVIVLGMISLDVPRLGIRGLSFLYVINAVAISFALYRVDEVFGGLEPNAFAFQAAKLSIVVTGLLAPSTLSGMAALGVIVGSSIWQYFHFPQAIRDAIITKEPWALLGFAFAGLVLLIHRMRVAQIQERDRIYQIQSESTRRLAENFLQLRDLMNTPLQSIEIASALLEKQPNCKPDIIDSLRKSCQSLRQINVLLRRYESQFDWSRSRGGLGD